MIRWVYKLCVRILLAYWYKYLRFQCWAYKTKSSILDVLYFRLFPDFFILALPPLIKRCRKLSLNRSLHGFASHNFPFTFQGFWSKSRYLHLLFTRFSLYIGKNQGKWRTSFRRFMHIFFKHKCSMNVFSFFIFTLCNL